jgi:hypothetical protein
MTRPALHTLWIGVFLVVLMGLFPPWVKVRTHVVAGSNIQTQASLILYHDVEYGFLWSPPDRDNQNNQVAAFVDLSRLLVQWVIVGALTLAIVLTFNGEARASKTAEARQPG